MPTRHGQGMKAALAAGALLASAAHAQEDQLIHLPPERPAQPVRTIPAGSLPGAVALPGGQRSGGSEMRAVPTLPDRSSKPILLKLAPVPWLGVTLIPQNDMTGWTALTNGATKGGASVVRLPGGGGQIIVRGADDGLYVAPVELAQPGGPIDAAAWRSLGATATSEANCRVAGFGYMFGCAWLGTNGNAVYAFLSANPSGTAAESYDLGGSKADGRPALAALSITPGVGLTRRVRMLVLGNETMFLRTQSTTGAVEQPNPLVPWGGAPGSVDDTGWTRMTGSFVTSAQCDADRCAYVRSGGLLGLGDPANEMPGAGAPPLPGGWSKTAPAPVRLASGKYAVIARSANGRIYRTVTDGGTSWTPWADEGGTVMASASVSCVAEGERPLCFAQGLDGRIYWKKLGTASGL
ncbi:hypothetical protein M9979_07185 [Sphingomonas sp. RP10(2022)]|uniref:Uncharacterized protein n=1 Tax=Sphingomonas liriopis TaxID=2949094 RepID=A0A9X2KT93_9SPHN|nr:hypothetical protein [Sphingomonas liriopis]MCP3734653.1 hypothetical protein [Sphingomonas liriopis]